MLMLLSVHMTRVLLLVLAGNSPLTVGFYQSYTLLLQPFILMRSCFMYICSIQLFIHHAYIYSDIICEKITGSLVDPLSVRGQSKFCPHLIPALFLTHLTVPAQLLEPFRFYPVGNGFGRQPVVFWHLCDLCTRVETDCVTVCTCSTRLVLKHRTNMDDPRLRPSMESWQSTCTLQFKHR